MVMNNNERFKLKSLESEDHLIILQQKRVVKLRFGDIIIHMKIASASTEYFLARVFDCQRTKKQIESLTVDDYDQNDFDHAFFVIESVLDGLVEEMV